VADVDAECSVLAVGPILHSAVLRAEAPLPSSIGRPVSGIAIARPRLLIVDDDPLICQSYDEVLRANGYDVAVAGSRRDALQEIERLGGGIDVLVLDIALPDADGADLAHEISDNIGTRPTLYVSGWTDEFWNLSSAPGRWLVMQKPIPVPRLLAAVDYLAGRRPTGPDLD
jgi:DNA-binding response OmpR family regulator